MNRTKGLMLLAGAAMCLVACGGSGGSVSSIPAPPAPAPTPTPSPSPSPSPTPTATPAVALSAPLQTASPPTPVAAAGIAGFSNPVIGALLPLTITAVTGDFGGDKATTDAGATLSYGSQGYRYTLNNAGAGIVDKPITSQGNDFFSPTTAQPIIGMWGSTSLYDQQDDLDFTRFGYWRVPTATNYYLTSAGGAWLGGYITPAANIPLAGTAEYKGATFGLVGANENMSHIAGDVQLSADFGSSKINGAINHIMFGEDAYNVSSLVVGFNADFNRAANSFVGTTQLTSPSSGPFLKTFSTAAKGDISGHFYGPSAQEAGAVWTLSEGIWRIIGSFGVKR